MYLDLTQFEKPQVYDDGNGIQIHTLKGVLHREDGPAVISPTHQEWYHHGKLHRTDGPARMFHVAPDGQERVAEWWMEGKYHGGACLEHEVFHQHLHKHHHNHQEKK